MKILRLVEKPDGAALVLRHARCPLCLGPFQTPRIGRPRIYCSPRCTRLADRIGTGRKAQREAARLQAENLAVEV